MLNLRGLYFADGAGTTSETPSAIASAIRFKASFVVGNLGATLSVPASFAPASTQGQGGDVERSVAQEGVDLRAGGAEGTDLDARDEREWYTDEEPAFARDPFIASLAMDAAELARLPGCALNVSRGA